MSDQLPTDDSARRRTWRCPACGRLNRPSADSCECGFVYGDPPPAVPVNFTPVTSRPVTFRSVTDTPVPVPPPASGMRPPADTSRVRDTNPLVSIFFFPRATIRHIVSTNIDLYVPVLLVLAAFFNMLGRATGRNIGDRISVWIIVLVALALAPLAIPFTRLGAWFGEWAGGKLGGVGTRDEVRAAYAWASVPAVAHSFVFWPVQAALFGGEIFRSASPLMDESHPMILIIIAVSAIFAYFWSVIVGIQVFAEVHQFSAWRAIGSMLLMMFIVLVPFVALIVVAIALAPR